jgi:hypothetical protein
MPRISHEEEGDSDDEDTLIAFTTRSRGSNRQNSSSAARAQSSTTAKYSTDEAPTTVPYVGSIEGVADIELCTDSGASLERHMEDTEKLLAAFESAVQKHEPLIAKAVVMTEERCNAQKIVEKREAVETATLAAIQATEMRMNAEMKKAVTQAVEATRAEAMLAQQAAVGAAVRLAQERAAEQQRLAIQAIKLQHQREANGSSEEAATSNLQSGDSAGMPAPASEPGAAQSAAAATYDEASDLQFF